MRASERKQGWEKDWSIDISCDKLAISLEQAANKYVATNQPCYRSLPYQEGFQIWDNKGQIEGFRVIFFTQMIMLWIIFDQNSTNFFTNSRY